MKLNVKLSIQSIKQAKKQLKRIEKLFKNGDLIKEYIKFVCQWVIDRANEYLKYSEIGENVKTSIIKGWQYQLTDTGAKITNKAEKAVFVEFGVGIVGQVNLHPNASVNGYEYNKPTQYKDQNGMWYFWTNSNELDIPKTSLEDIRGYDDFRGEQGKRIIVGTRGAEGVMYAYNAIVDAQNELKKPNGVFAQEYKKLLERYVR